LDDLALLGWTLFTGGRKISFVLEVIPKIQIQLITETTNAIKAALEERNPI
jgi:hypothetical protein